MTDILLKRSTTPGNTPPLSSGEAAVNLADHRFFVGGGASQGYPLGCQSTAYPKRVDTPKIAGDVAGTALGGVTITANREYFAPFVVPRLIELSGLRINVTTGASGTAQVGIYANAVIAGNDAPGALLASVTGLDTTSTGDQSGSFGSNLTLEPGRMYWVGLIASAGPGMRGLTTGSLAPSLGRLPGGTAILSYLYGTGSGGALDNPAPATLNNAAGSAVMPAVYLLEV
ncbi:hypothetical protein [Methylomonas sp. HYX-M1]|uniref:hypothetical protein n=1 Tax=Methylomonas sp. HYX-M1 TaxID=3139307 RepID=UPI00345BE341